MQRDAVAALVDRRYHRLARQAEHRADQARGLDQSQARQPDLLGEPLAQQPGPQLTHRQCRIELVAAVRADNEHRPRRKAPGQVAQYIQAQLIGPVQILQHDQDRTARIHGDQQVGQILHEQAAAVVRVTGVR